MPNYELRRACRQAGITNYGKIFRILDANLNRATEGLRVVEEICRFVLEDPKLTLVVKKLRGGLSKIIRISGDQREGYQAVRGSGTLLKERKASEDVGRELYTKGEGRRANIESVFRANMKRAQEALRCLEEFSKLISPKPGKKFKAIRFRLYELEKIIAPRVAKAVKLDFDLYVITDPRFDHLQTVRRAVGNGVRIAQLRDKTVSKREYYRLAAKTAVITRRAGAAFILNDYWDLVNKVGADGVHLGQEDIKHLSLRSVRKKMGADKIIGVSTHSFQQAVSAEKLGADYISIGPIFSTPSKPGVKPVGLGLLRRVVRRVKIPVVAIGGINGTKVNRVRQSGCRRIAVIRAAREIEKLRQP